MTTSEKLAQALRDTATSLETIGRLAGKSAYLGDDGEKIPTYMEHHDEVRGYANSRASVARAALATWETGQQAEPAAWRDHVEQRIRGWRQRTMNRSGDHMAIDDFMDGDSLEDLIDHVCDEYASPPSAGKVVVK